MTWSLSEAKARAEKVRSGEEVPLILLHAVAAEDFPRVVALLEEAMDLIEGARKLIRPSSDSAAFRDMSDRLLRKVEGSP